MVDVDQSVEKYIDERDDSVDHDCLYKWVCFYLIVMKLYLILMIK